VAKRNAAGAPSVAIAELRSAGEQIAEDRGPIGNGQEEGRQPGRHAIESYGSNRGQEIFRRLWQDQSLLAKRGWAGGLAAGRAVLGSAIQPAPVRD